MFTEEIQILDEAREELKNLEFKTSTAELQSACETLCAFLNDNGGRVLIGVKNNGDITGQMVTDRTKQEISNHIKKYEPPADIHINYQSLENGKYIIEISVAAGPHAPYVFNGRPYQRIETTTRIMPQQLYEELLVERGHLNHDWDSFCVWDPNTVELDHEIIAMIIQNGINVKRIPENSRNENIKQILQRLDLFDNGHIKNAGLILFAKKMPDKLIHSEIRLARFDGLSETNNFIDNQVVQGNAFRLLDEASDFIRRHMSIASFYQQESFIRLDKPTLPVLAVREALINAICHRDYQSKASITMAIFDNRLELWNPGKLPRHLKIEELNSFHKSFPRNKLISNVFYNCGWIEQWGTGTIKIFDSCKKHNLPPPIFKETSGGILVTFMYAESMSKVGNKPVLQQQLSKRQQMIITILDSSLQLTSLEIFTQLGEEISARTLRHELAKLKSLGLIDSTGRSSNAVWHKVT